MSNYGFLQKYIQQNNNEVPLEDILNDEDFLDELKFKEEGLINL
jgi:hypothetical protein